MHKDIPTSEYCGINLEENLSLSSSGRVQCFLSYIRRVLPRSIQHSHFISKIIEPVAVGKFKKQGMKAAVFFQLPLHKGILPLAMEAPFTALP